MRYMVLGILWLSTLACLAQAPSSQQQSFNPPAQDGGVREVLESIVIPPIPHSPFTATLATEWVRYSADGATITVANQRRIARDEQGRLYEERWYLVPKDSNVQSQMNWIQIADAKRRTLYNCSVLQRVCNLVVYDPSRDLSAAAPRTGSSHALPDGSGLATWEELGNRVIAGIETTGVRETTTINPGTMGNDRPLTSMSETWHSQQLAINLLSIRTNPLFGKQTFTITEVTTTEPDPQLFALPAGYKVNDQRKSAPASQ